MADGRLMRTVRFPVIGGKALSPGTKARLRVLVKFAAKQPNTLKSVLQLAVMVTAFNG
jgi:hypothetical protein